MDYLEAEDAIDPNTIITDTDIDIRNFSMTDDVTMSDGFKAEERDRIAK